MWYVLLGAIVIAFILDMYSILKGKPTHKSALKRCINNWVYLLLGFGIIFAIQIVWILAIIGNQELAKSSEINVIVIANGLQWMFTIGTASFLFVTVLDALNMLVRKNKTQIWSIYFNWTEKLDKEGFFKYTDDEKAYNKQKDDEFKAKIHKIFPMLARKKVV